MLFLILSMPISCRAEKKAPFLELPATPILTSEYLWGVSNRPYLKILESPDSDSAPKQVLRHGDIVKIISKVVAKKNRSYWFEVQVPESEISGWTLDENINIYDSSVQARTARSYILESN